MVPDEPLADVPACPTGSPAFARVPATWLAYLLTGYFVYMQASLGPVVPFLREELGLDYGVAGLHFGTFALGVVLTGALADRPVRLLGRRVALWSGAFGMAMGATVLAAGGSATATLSGVLLMGLWGSLLLMTAQATLSDLHGENRAVALTEANVAAATGAILAPVAIAAFAAANFLGWRGALVAAVVTLAAGALLFLRTPVPNAAASANPDEGTPDGGRTAFLPSAFWAWCAVLFLCISIEWSVAYWGAAFLEDVAGLTAAHAAALMGAYFVAVLLGRLAASRLARQLGPETLLMSALGVSAGGFAPFWLAPLMLPPGAAAFALGAAGLFVAGVGIGSLYPLSAALTIGAASGMADRATSRMALAGGFATLVAPIALGAGADSFGIGLAYGLVAALLLATTAVTAAVGRGMRTG